MKIIYGVSGTGKSEYIFNKIKESGKEKTYIVTPEQFSFTAEKKLIDTNLQGATLSCEVLSFERMAYKVIKETLGDKYINISKSGKSEIIYDAIINNQEDLKFLGKSQENIDTILTQITEFKKHNITIDKLEKQKDSTEDIYLKSKLNDMLIMYKSLENKIQDKFLDENDLLTMLAENIEQSHLFDNAIFYIDEFAGFTKQEYLVISKLDKIAKELYITVCTDDLRITKEPEQDVFYDNKQTIQSLCQIFDIDKDNQIKLSNKYRFKSKELYHLEENLFAVPYKIYNEEIKDIKLNCLDNKYEEIENVANNIIKLIRDNGYRYKDIAVICNDIESYSSLCKAIFSEYEIPVFIDTKKDITQNLLIKYVLSIFDIFTKNWSYEAVFNYIKTGFLSIERIYELENYCLKWGIKGKKWYSNPWNYEKIENNDVDINFNEEQNLIINPLLQLKEKLSEEKTADKISIEIYNFIENQISFFLSNQTNKQKFNDNMYEAWQIVCEVLEEIANIFKDKKISFDHYSKILKIGLLSKELGQIPQTQDKVIVGDVNRSRTHKVKAVFIIGVNDGVFPSVISSEGFFNDKDRENLKAQGFELAKGTREKMYEENFNIYKAFSTAEEKLFISYPKSDFDGNSLRRSLIISKLKRIFPKLKEDSKGKDEILTKTITFSKLLNNIESEEWNEVYEWYNRNYKEKLNAAILGLKFSNVPEKLNNESIKKLYGEDLRTSISKLENYSSCPFSYFLKYGLKLSDKEKFNIKPIDTGTFMHNTIDEFFRKADDIKNLTEENIKNLLDKIVDEELLNGGKFMLTAKYRVLVQRLKKVLFISMKYIVQSLKCSSFDILGTEVDFGKGANPPIEIKLDNGKKVLIEGKIDRIDIAKMPDGNYIRIIDYKSSSKDLDLNKVVAGIQIQLITYIDAICKKNEDINPAGALYFALLEPKILENTKKLDKEEIEKLIEENYKMQGLVLANVNIIKAMDTNLTEGKSNTIPVTLNKSGEINYSKSSAITREEFENLQKYTNKIIKQISKEILDGNIELRPYFSMKEKNTPCRYCEYKTICKFNSKFKGNDYKYIENKKRQDVLNEINEKS